MPDEKVPEEISDFETRAVEPPPAAPVVEPPAEPVAEPPAAEPPGAGPPPVEDVGEPVVEAPAAPPAAVVSPVPPASPPAPVPPPPPPTGTSNNKLWALLAYVLSPVAPIVILLVENMKNQPDLKPHTMQALVSGAAIIVVTLILTVIPIIGCLAPLVALVGWIAMIYWGVQAYNGKTVTIPVVTDFVQKQGWA